MESHSLPSPALFEDVIKGSDPFVIIRRGAEEEVQVLSGAQRQCHSLAEIPRNDGVSPIGGVDTVCAIPFAQVRERGYGAHSDHEPIRCVDITRQTRVRLQELLAAIPSAEVKLENDIQFDRTPGEYAAVIRRILDDEIGRGEGANFVVANTGRGTIVEMNRAKALNIYRSLLHAEHGSYMTFIFYDGEKYLIGASPERHLTVGQGTVTMNPISGTYRKKPDMPVTKEDLLKFLRNDKEIMELFMVLDEELKMMSQMCERGGTVGGPLLKNMSQLIHTEYLLRGHSDRSAIDLLRTSMFAPTVTGSPVGNACKVLRKYEPDSRGYYSGALALFGRDAQGEQTLDSAITIRTAEVENDGRLVVRAGATLVRDSDPESEVKETQSKLSALLGSILHPVRERSVPSDTALLSDEEILQVLKERNRHLSRYFLDDQEPNDNTLEAVRGKTITIVDNGDDFCHTLRHMMTSMGAKVEVVNFQEFDCASDTADLVVVGPGPGDPNDRSDPKMRKLRKIVRDLRGSEKKFLAVCLGHQILSRELGMEVVRQEKPSQGVRENIDLFGEQQLVGFYNTFSAQRGEEIPGVQMSYDEDSRRVHALRSGQFASFQFHPESVLSENGFRILGETLTRLLGSGAAPSTVDGFSVDDEMLPCGLA
ncbi:MAG: anthranilate synthase family protein [Candidatus Peribacteraceae bacterium]|nr:anthranilate synthase family protein [Candidatus Peribacteraceae bacterium]MDD5074312.1 anthranilate synthase family protein [Candidatus Peribacteraceae bacterium]